MKKDLNFCLTYFKLEKHGTIKKDLHFGFIYLKQERTMRPCKDICPFASYISNCRRPWDHEEIFALLPNLF
jgi:hypothetical protein